MTSPKRLANDHPYESGGKRDGRGQAKDSADGLITKTLVDVAGHGECSVRKHQCEHNESPKTRVVSARHHSADEAADGHDYYRVPFGFALVFHAV